MNASAGAPIVVLGAGGHAKVVVSLLQALDLPIRAVYDDNPDRWGQKLLGVPVEGAINDVADLAHVRAVIGIGDNQVRKRVAIQFAHAHFLTLVHPRAFVHPSVQLGAGTVVFAGAVVQPDAVVGAHVVINTGATVDHDSRLGDFVHVGPGSHLAGSVRIEEGTLLGAGSTVIPGCTVGAWSRVGAGGVVVRDLPAHVTAVGVPARPIGGTQSVGG